MGILEKIKDIELEMSRTQKNKATEGHLKHPQVQARQAPHRAPRSSKSGGEGDGFEVSKYGHGRVALIGFPSVGASPRCSPSSPAPTPRRPRTSSPRHLHPGVIHTATTRRSSSLDLPWIIEGASEGKGRGRQVIAVAKSSDLILMVLDATKSEAANSRYAHKEILTRELEAVGLRLNQTPPRVYIKKKHSGGVQMNNTVPGGLTRIDESTVLKVLAEYKIHHCELLIREDIDVDQLIDVLEGNRKYIRCLYVYNKVDALTIEEVDSLSRRADSVCISCYLELGMDQLLRRMWAAMGLVRGGDEEDGEQTGFREPVVLAEHRGGHERQGLLRSDSQHDRQEPQVRPGLGTSRQAHGAALQA